MLMENVIKGVHKKELKNRRPQRKYEYNRDVRAGERLRRTRSYKIIIKEAETQSK